MTIVAKRSFGFTASSVYRRKEPHAFRYLSERATFWIAVLSVFAFVTGNMVGQHGWNVFWKSVLGEGDESLIVFTGTVPPIANVPDLERWAALGGDVRSHTFRQVPADVLVALPLYDGNAQETSLEKRVYYVHHLGTYDTGRGEGSHPGVDIAVPVGTPVQSIAAGIVTRADNDPGGYGNFIVVKHPNVPDPDRPGAVTALYSVYGHLSAIGVGEGAVVMKGEQIGLSGKTGFATGPHLHFQIDRDSAPWHPYWPFTSAEARTAGLSFVQAINQGLHRERGKDFTLDPIPWIAGHQQYTAPVATADTAEKSSSASSRRPMTVAERRALRLSKRGTAVAVAEPVKAPVTAAAPSSANSSSSAASVAARTGIGAVAGLRISHDGSFTKTRGWERVTLMLLDADGRVVTDSSSTERITLRTAYGRAEFKPSVVSIADFRNGVVQVEMLPLGEQTVVVQAEPFRQDLSEPMKYVRN